MENCLLTPIGKSKFTPLEEALKEVEGMLDAPEGLPGNASETGQQPAAPIVWRPGMKCIVDMLPAYEGAYKNQDWWIDYFNSLNDGRFFASMPDYYHFFKQLKNSIETGNDNDTSQAVVQSLRKDFTDKLIVTSTRIQYGINPRNSLEGRIIHHYGCNNTSLIKESIKEIPIYSDAGIAKVVRGQKGLKYLQAYFGTSDNGETIVQLMEFISGKKRNKINLCTEDNDTRSHSITNVAALYFGGGFRIYGDGILDVGGRARGVRYEQR